MSVLSQNSCAVRDSQSSSTSSSVLGRPQVCIHNNPTKQTLQYLYHSLLLILENWARLKIPSLQMMLAAKQIQPQLRPPLSPSQLWKGLMSRLWERAAGGVWLEGAHPSTSWWSSAGWRKVTALAATFSSHSKGPEKIARSGCRNRIATLQESSEVINWVSFCLSLWDQGDVNKFEKLLGTKCPMGLPSSLYLPTYVFQGGIPFLTNCIFYR